MKQILQDTKTGKVSVFDVPTPVLQPGSLLVRTSTSLISSGTERMAVDTAQKGLLARAKERPDLVRQVVERVRSEGLSKTYAAVRSKFESKTALGYSSAGRVIGVGQGVTGYTVGERVACAGVGYASHAEIVCVPANLCVRVPEHVSDDEAAFATIGAVALQGVRLSVPTLGEAAVVIGLGLIGQITIQLLKANGCRVFGIDIDETRFDLAQELGADLCSTPSNAVDLVQSWSRGRGADLVLITAGTKSNDPIELAGDICRLKGRVVVVGMVGLNIPRSSFFSKEISLQVSMSYGPGRYDANYEERGHDYPFSYVRWTEGRNLEAFLDLIASRRMNVSRLITHRVPISDGENPYRLISGESKEPYLGIVLTYDDTQTPRRSVELRRSRGVTSGINIGLIGAGDYARGVLLPQFRDNRANFQVIASASGVSARNIGDQFGFVSAVSSAEDVINDAGVDLVVIATRHDTHSGLAASALRVNKHVFVEKPLALNEDDLRDVMEAAHASEAALMVGFNRRFSPSAIAAKEFFSDLDGALSILCRINAGRIPREHWTQDPVVGGGRIIGEMCHFVDLIHFLTNSVTTRVFAEGLSSTAAAVSSEDSVFVTIKLANGSNASIVYLAEGDKALPKERIEIFGGGRSFLIDDFRSHTAYSNGKPRTVKLSRQDKGQAEQIRSFCTAIFSGGQPLIPLEELRVTTLATFRILESLRTSEVVPV